MLTLSTQTVVSHAKNSLGYLLPEHWHLSIYLTNYFMHTSSPAFDINYRNTNSFSVLYCPETSEDEIPWQWAADQYSQKCNATRLCPQNQFHSHNTRQGAQEHYLWIFTSIKVKFIDVYTFTLLEHQHIRKDENRLFFQHNKWLLQFCSFLQVFLVLKGNTPFWKRNKAHSDKDDSWFHLLA